MPKVPLISVVMPVYNCEQYVREAIESILHQTFQEFEFIIINDGSTDQTPEILNEYAKKDIRIKVINQLNSGIVVALNRGLFESKSEWIFRMDGDDIALPHRFAVQIKAIEKNPSLILLGGWCQQINTKGVFLKVNKYPSHHNKLIHNLEAHNQFFPHPTACFRRGVVMKLEGYRERFRHAEDIDLWFRMVGHGQFACCDDVILCLRKHEKNISDFDFGRIQQVKAVAAFICNFQRKYRRFDPSQMNEKNWQEFLFWIENEMDSNGYFRKMRGMDALRKVWYSKPGTNMLKRGVSVVRELIRNPVARKIIWKQFGNSNFILKLAKRSEEALK
ncbi:hypothetical protein KsCSTR_47380 [Candidatus Kuenenia stuttgartiensis]|jgi:glycosyltransferase involved in cell wall biosynthesis|uniref:Glycosyltransferase 2-like domain-containing protein n=1 Tax=Kuenenia stuttgartiensis TaxID=174633 RepID=A0A2C9CGP1_KUEST|nr:MULTISPECIES: glycosyltransferase [Kuenenia]MBE7546022.1 glycosyltransferase [Planctomycetia bacterium]MCZ7562365.1 glycosyltransferase [Burkholderiales bacterium]MCZ7611853.1 glycosyltransferase [Ignavibacterium sp.]MBW7941379.1 glycosyltransferase [Candidatus Kuenenia stuttgartiensis]MBZ0191725.1 glycosyltransferase [Candidatus Kuenenia stuttgartiensis]